MNSKLKLSQMDRAGEEGMVLFVRPATAHSQAGVPEAEINHEWYRAATTPPAKVQGAAPEVRCQCCGYLATESEHKGCLRAVTPAAPFAGSIGDDRKFKWLLEFWAGKYHSSLAPVRAGHEWARADLIAYITKFFDSRASAPALTQKQTDFLKLSIDALKLHDYVILASELTAIESALTTQQKGE